MVGPVCILRVGLPPACTLKISMKRLERMQKMRRTVIPPVNSEIQTEEILLTTRTYPSLIPPGLLALKVQASNQRQSVLVM